MVPVVVSVGLVVGVTRILVGVLVFIRLLLDEREVD
jgi:hypothetical protein